MRTYLECYPCFLRQALNAGRHAGADEDQQHVIMQSVLQVLGQIEPGQTPPAIGDHVHRIVREVVGSSDPYRTVKAQSTAQALSLYPHLKARVDESDDPLAIALRISIAGNVIDFGPRDKIDNLIEEVDAILQRPIHPDDSASLRARLASAAYVLYMADNAGETVFDRVLIETLTTPVLYAVKGAPVLNDATLEDAHAAGLDQVATLTDTGSNALGTNLDRASADFRRTYAEAPLVIAKGQANYETLSEASDKVFCLLLVKCPIIAQDINVGQETAVLVGSPVVRQSTGV